MARFGRGRPLAPDWLRPIRFSQSTHILKQDIVFRYSGGANNNLIDNSIGGAMSSVRIVDNVLSNLWDTVTTAQEASGVINYACIYVLNNTPTGKTWGSAVLWIDGQLSQGSLAVGLDSAAVGATAVSSSTDIHTAPSPTITFSSPSNRSTALVIGDIPAGSYKAFWVQRTIPSSSSSGSDQGSLHCEGSTT